MHTLFNSRDSAPHALTASIDTLAPPGLATATFGVG